MWFAVVVYKLQLHWRTFGAWGESFEWKGKWKVFAGGCQTHIHVLHSVHTDGSESVFATTCATCWVNVKSLKYMQHRVGGRSVCTLFCWDVRVAKCVQHQRSSSSRVQAYMYGHYVKGLFAVDINLNHVLSVGALCDKMIECWIFWMCLFVSVLPQQRGFVDVNGKLSYAEMRQATSGNAMFAMCLAGTCQINWIILAWLPSKKKKEPKKTAFSNGFR